MALSFTATANLKKAVGLINGLDTTRFPLLLSRIIQKIHLKDERTFTDDEEEKLQKALSLQEMDLQLVIEALEFFFHQAAYHTAKPTVLTQQLTKLEMEESKVNAIVEAWTSIARDVTEKLRKRTLAPKQLEDVDWTLNLQMAQKTQAKMKLPNAVFQLGVSDEQTNEKEIVRIEFTHDELYSFYDQLETIQRQVDSLT